MSNITRAGWMYAVTKLEKMVGEVGDLSALVEKSPEAVNLVELEPTAELAEVVSALNTIIKILKGTE